SRSCLLASVASSHYAAMRVRVGPNTPINRTCYSHLRRPPQAGYRQRYPLFQPVIPDLQSCVGLKTR
ncbi:MAG TPA: hypothetical protein VEL68_16875, partial [Thermodesulfobacteriota bacterium]|nr:hypothetical protein [Thermodesulfobacteriota bacterium]